MPGGLSALLYLESRQIVNRLRTAVRQPSRLLLYAFIVLYFAFLIYVRSADRHARHIGAVSEPYASAAMFAFFTLLGVTAYGAASGFVGAFSSAADARFLIGSHISERLVVLWLQLRRSSTALLRMIFTIVLYTFIFRRSGTFLGIAFGMLGGMLLITALAVPLLKLRAIAGARTAQTLSAAWTALSILAMIALIASLLSPLPGIADLERLGAGRLFNAFLSAQPLALAVLFGIGVLTLILSYFCGTGLYPDLYASSLRMIAARAQSRRGGAAAFTMRHKFEHRSESAVTKRISAALSGPWTIVWKEWIAFQRSTSMQRIFLLGLFGCLMGGVIAGSVAMRSHDPMAISIAIATSAANLLVIFVAMGSAITLGADLRKPLWWIGPDPLWMRLFAWAAGTSWRLGACVAVALVAWALMMHEVVIAAVALPVAAAGVLYLRVVGLAIYSLFPSAVDQRGPLAFIRALSTYFLALPPIIAGVVAGIIFKSPVGGLATGVAVSALETLALIAFAAARIDGRGAAVAQAETM